MAQTNLYSLINQVTTSQDRQSKVQIGYTVDTYNGVLDALQLAIANGAYSGGDSDSSAVGDDISGIGELRWDNNDFSEDTSACLWKMELGLFGSLPIEDVQTKRYHIIKVRGNEETQISQTGCLKSLPFYLDKDKVITNFDDNFVVGCYIDINNSLLKYMNKFFTGVMSADYETGSSFKFTEEICWQLINNKCLVAQIIPEGFNGESVEVLVVGQSLGGGSKINVSPAFFATANGKRLNISISASGANEKEIIIPKNSLKYNCPIQDKSYNSDTGVIENFNHYNYKQWCKVSLNNEDIPAVEIDQLIGKKCFVRIYIPQSKKALAQNILKSNLPKSIYQTYSSIRYGEGTIPVGVNANISGMMRAITSACVKNGLKLYTEKDVKDAQGCPTAMGSNGAWIGAKGRSSAMKGTFTLPVGWPMCKIIQNYGGRSAEDQKDKGHPKQKGSKEVPWVETDTPERLDSALNELDSQILSGSKSKEWYQARIDNANKGRVTIYCNSKVADKFQQFFNEMWSIYKDAATIYNTGRPVEEHVSASEILLRCAPCLCAINGQSGVHRSRKNDKGQWREAGHDGGAAIDFDPSHNGTTSSKSENCNLTEIGKNMEVGYRPMLAVLYKLGGGWGGSYKFCSGKFDAMHIQF